MSADIARLSILIAMLALIVGCSKPATSPPVVTTSLNGMQATARVYAGCSETRACVWKGNNLQPKEALQ